jgi:hypothetical protein
MEIIKFSVRNWGKFQPRKDMKSLPWIRIDRDIFNDVNYFSLDIYTKIFWIYVLCQCAKRNNSTCEINIDAASSQIGCTKNELLTSIEILEQIQYIENKTRIRTDNIKLLHKSVSDETRRDETERDGTKRNETKLNISKIAKKIEKPKPPKKLTDEIRAAYVAAYESRYKTKPIFNARVNGNISQLAARLGADAAHVVDFFVRHNDGFYVKSCHSIGLCLRDAEALHTQWKRGVSITSAKIREFEKQSVYEETMRRIDEEGI